jgi:hypothetical protein
MLPRESTGTKPREGAWKGVDPVREQEKLEATLMRNAGGEACCTSCGQFPASSAPGVRPVLINLFVHSFSNIASSADEEMVVSRSFNKPSEIA